MVKKHVRKFIFEEKYFPLQVYIDENAEQEFKDAVLDSIKIWNKSYNDYLSKHSKQLVWKGVPIGHFVLSRHYSPVIPAWSTRELFTIIQKNHFPDVVLIKDNIDDGTTLGTHTSRFILERPPFFMGRVFLQMLFPPRLLFSQPKYNETLGYSSIKIDQNKINEAYPLRDYFLTNVLMHELGHALGLAHFNQTDFLMKAYIDDCGGICPISDSVFEEFLTPFLNKMVDFDLLRNPRKWARKEKNRPIIALSPGCERPSPRSYCL